MHFPPNTTLTFDPSDGFFAHTPTAGKDTITPITDAAAFGYMRDCNNLHTADALSNRAAFDMYYAALVQGINDPDLTKCAHLAQQMVAKRNIFHPL